MQWKYSFPDPWTNPATRVALEDVYLIPPDGKTGPSSYWLTLEGLHSFTGGTREEKLERLGGADYVISDAMDMLVRRGDFDKEELLDWTRVFIRLRLGDPDPVLVEATQEECARRMSTARDPHNQQLRTGRMKLLFVHARGGPVQPVPEEVLHGDPRVEVRTTSLVDEPLTVAEEEVASWADVIVVMERRMRHILRRRLKQAGKDKRVVCLHLPEHHDLQDPAYLTLFRERIDVYLEKLAPERTL
jgi:predicted protein tyrosine phosphatase